MNQEELKKLADEAGLVYSGLNADGELEFIGTKQKWERYEFLLEGNGRLDDEMGKDNQLDR